MSCWGHGHATERPWWISPSCRCTPKARWSVDLGWWLRWSVPKTIWDDQSMNWEPLFTNSWSLDWFYLDFFLRNHVFFTVGNVGFLWILPSTSSGIEVLPNPIRQLPFTTCCLGAIKIMQKQQVYYWVYRMIHAKMGLSLRKLWT